MSKSINDCPYLKTVHIIREEMPHIKEDFELQYNKDHIVERVKVGETDIDKEVESHKNEVGLVNVFKNAIAHGEDPMSKFNKVEPGSGIGVDPNATLDDLLALSNENEKKLNELGAQFGLTGQQLVDAVKEGRLEAILKASEKKEEETKTEVNE